MALTKVSRGLLSTSIEDNGNATAITIDSSENVGIGTSSPTFSSGSFGGLHVHGSSGTSLRMTNAASGQTASDGYEILLDPTSKDTLYVNRESANQRFYTGGSERARIDSSGNLLVGTTSTDPAASSTETGVALKGGGFVSISRNDSAASVNINKIGYDGSLVDFRKNGSTVGSIGVVSGNNLNIHSTSSGHSGLSFGTGTIFATDNAGDATDNITDLGASSYRFDDIYATNGTIQTSDRNEKQDIAELSDAEQRVAVACKGLMRKFRWKDSVAEKGDDARIHFGIIAQDLQDAFEAEGLDASRYAMWCSDTWWEQDVEVPAVEAVDAVYETQTDEEGNETQVLVQEAVEAVDAYTRTDTFETAEEAPEGATERTRLGVRYSELLAFIISAL